MYSLSMTACAAANSASGTRATQTARVRSIHLLAVKKNTPVVRTYSALGFDFIGECHRYGADYYVCEKLL